MNENILQYVLQSIGWVLSQLLSVLTPLLIGLVIAYLLHPMVNWLTRKIHHRGCAIFLTYLSTAVFLGALICGFVILILGALPAHKSLPTLRTLTKRQMPFSPTFSPPARPLRLQQASQASRNVWNAISQSKLQSQF